MHPATHRKPELRGPKLNHRLLPTLVLSLVSCAARAEPPRLTSAVPDHGDTGVDPALTELRITFDQDMDPGHSICGGGPTFPKLTGTPRWESPRLLIVPVSLEPAHRYQLSINCPAARNFRSVQGEPCDITPISFVTAKAGETPPAPRPLTPDENAAAVTTLRRAIDERYSYRDRVVKDWDAAFAASHDALLTATTRAQFARETARLLGAARDVHIAVVVNDAWFPSFRAEPRVNADPRTLPAAVPRYERRSDIVSTGVYEDGTIYISISSWPSNHAALEPAHAFLTEHATAPRAVIDVRLNGGGDESIARRFAARFARDRAVYSRARTRTPDRPTGWTPYFDRTIAPAESADPRTGAIPPPFAGPCAVLIGPGCMSSNESFVLMMKHGAKATLVGAATFGASGNPRPTDLGNGVTARLPSWEDLLPNDKPLEGRGIDPDVAVEFSAGATDPVLDAALARLRSLK